MKSLLSNLLEIKVDNSCISNIILIMKNKTIYSLDINRKKAKYLKDNYKDNIISFNFNWKFYFLMKIRYNYVFAIKYLDEFIIKKIRYFIDDIIINHITHCLSEDNLVTKKCDNSKTLIKNNKITYYK